jgi:hypothetical protein
MRVMRLGGAEVGDHARQGAVGTAAQIDRLDRQPHRIDADHASQVRSQAANSVSLDSGQRIWSALFGVSD